VQRAKFLQGMVQAAVKRDRFRIGDETLEYSRAQLEAASQCSDIRELATARFTLAFVLVMRGFDEEAEPLFVAAINDARRMDDALLRTRFESYHAILLRRLGRLVEARKAAESLLAYAEERTMLDYVGVAHANLSWCAWRTDRHTDALSHANEALAAWDKLRPGYVYPLQWLARMPLAACLQAASRTDEAVEHWGLMLQDPQQRLPDELETAIERTLALRDGPSLAGVLEAASRHRFL
ncbi:MAG TPA: hypothetical protein VF395_20910, partial [Polyangiaceae bacterium]